MAELGTLQKEKLQEVVGEENVRFDQRTRVVYSQDVGAMPKLIKPFLPVGTPGAVVRPRTVKALQDLMAYAREQGIPLVPRAWGSAGYGGTVPPKDAIVVDMTGWTKIVDVDKENLTVTTQAACVWELIDREIKQHGLTLRMYPSSYPVASPGGMLAQGGSGFGSYEYGSFADTVVSCQVVMPTGEVKTFSGNELRSYIYEAEGTTGIITEVTFKVRKLEDEIHELIACDSSDALQKFLDEVYGRKIPLWTMLTFNPTSVALKEKLPARSMHSYETMRDKPKIPEAYLVMIAYPAARKDQVDADLHAAAQAAGATFLPEAAAEYEWEERFSPMRLKRVGPSIIPTEVIIPAKNFGAALKEIDEKIKQSFVMEAMCTHDGNVVLLGFIPHDERSFGFNVAFELSLAVTNIAKRNGGKAYSTGLYFKSEAESVFGRERYEELTRYKESIDPNYLLNPNKVVGKKGTIDHLMSLASRMDGLIRPIANRAVAPKRLRRKQQADKNGVPGEVGFDAYACSRCGYCIPTCEQYSVRGWESDSPRGKYTWIREIMEGRAKWDRDAIDTMMLCTTCEMCNNRCQLYLPVEHDWMKMRGELVHEQKFGTFPPFEMMGAALESEGDIWAGKRENRDGWLPDDLRERLHENGEYLYFPGCTASYVEHDIAEATTRLLLDAGYDLAYMGNDENCCGIPMKMAGKWDLFEEIYERNVAEAKKRGVKTIVTSCPACALSWKELYRDVAKKRGEKYDFKVKHYSELIAEAIKDGRLKPDHALPELGKVTFHDSCHAGRAQGIYDEPRTMLDAIPGLEYQEMKHCREEGICCGSVLTLVGEMEVAPKLGNHRLQEAVEIGADTVVAMCPCCQVQLRDSVEKNNLPLKVEDLSRVAALSCGYDIPSSSDESLKQWGYFEKFIPLMRPQNMAKVMEKVFPQMLDAMPAGMGKMMVPFAKSGAGRGMIAAMMPKMFPMMAPSILDKVMPDLIGAVKETVGEIPEDMNELLPDLLPVTMEHMMPSYLPELIPHVVPLFVDFLEKEANKKAA